MKTILVISKSCELDEEKIKPIIDSNGVPFLKNGNVPNIYEFVNLLNGPFWGNVYDLSELLDPKIFVSILN